MDPHPARVSADQLTPTRPLFVQPHPDDAVLSSFSLLSRAVDPVVVTVFSGVPGADVAPTAADRMVGIESPRERMLERRVEDREALGELGARAVHLDFVELAHRGDPDETNLVAVIADALVPHAHDRDAIVTVLGIGDNPNHVQVSDAVRLVARRTALPVLWTADYPYAVAHGWPHWVAGASPDPLLRPDATWERHLERVGRPRHVTIIDLDEHTRREKLRVFGAYRTQVAVVERGDNRVVSNPAHVAHEVVWSSAPLAG